MYGMSCYFKSWMIWESTFQVESTTSWNNFMHNFIPAVYT